MVDAYKKLMAQKHNEDKWQAFFTNHMFALDMAFGYPVKQVATKAYVGGKDLSGKGGQYTDFLMAARSTGNAAIIEIKHPGCELHAKRSYRDRVYGPSVELSGAVTQVLSQRALLQANIQSLNAQSADMSSVRGYAVSTLIIIGTTPVTEDQRRSFELFRHSMKDVQIVTFDELQTRLEMILKMLQP